jgi:DNA-binding winged helix-turn-helix (wHTH) protein/Tfp pilus assembly protein PilF
MGAIAQLDVARVQLALEPPLRIGTLQVDPSTRQIEGPDGPQTLEPRVMQVLVALARAEGRVVSRDELIATCWDQRIVGEDSINRVLSRLRHIAAEVGNGSFGIETIRGVGYRLTTAPQNNATDRPMGMSRRTVMAVSTAAVVTAAGSYFAFWPRHKPLPLAVQYYQQGLESRGQSSLELYEQGTALLREATRIDPQYSDAWGSLAWNYRGLLQFGPRPDFTRLESLSRSAAERALELDPGNVEAQAALLLLQPFFRHWLAMERGLRRLIAEHPHNSILEYNLAFTLGEVGRWRESIPLLRAVSERERFWPLPHVDLMKALHAAGRLEETEDLIEEGLRRFPRRADYWMMKVRYLALAGRYAEALAFADDMASRPALKIDRPLDFEIMVVKALDDGSTAAKDKVLRQITDLARQQSWYLPVAISNVAVLGQVDLAFLMLEGCFFGSGPWAAAREVRPVTRLLFGPSTTSLRSSPRFPELLRATGLEDYWRETGTQPDFRRFG